MTATLSFLGIVLKKTKLGEADLIISLLLEDGSCEQVVARGARKPKNSFASRLELFSFVQLFCAQTKGLPVAQEARLLHAHEALRCNFEASLASSCVSELMLKVTHTNVTTPRLFEMCEAAFQLMSETSPEKTYALALASCLKAFAFCGLRPSFCSCISCGASIKTLDQSPNTTTETSLVDKLCAFSFQEGGYVCGNCRENFETRMLSVNCLNWLEALLKETFVNINTLDVTPYVISFGFHFVQEWAGEHLNTRLKSIPILLTHMNTYEKPC